MFENLGRFFKRMVGTEPKELDVATKESKETAKERLHLVLMQDRANVSADFLELMKQEIIDVIKKYIEVDEETIDVRLTTKTNEDGSNGTPALYANIPILNIRNDMKVENFNFALQSDGSIIAHKIEEPIQEEMVQEIDIENTIQEENIIEEKIDSLISENLEETENTFVENVNEFDSETIDSEDFSKIEERQDDIINQVIPVIENIAKTEEVNNTEIEKIDEIIEQEDIENPESKGIVKEVKEFIEEIKEEIKEEINEIKEEIQETKEENSAKQDDTLTIEDVQQLKKSCKRGRPRKKDKKTTDKQNKKNSKAKKDSSNSDEEEDDDVTFDDLLKAAEEEDRRLAEQEKKEGK